MQTRTGRRLLTVDGWRNDPRRWLSQRAEPKDEEHPLLGRVSPFDRRERAPSRPGARYELL